MFKTKFLTEMALERIFSTSYPDHYGFLFMRNKDV